MPLKAHFQGKGQEVMSSMMKTYPNPEKAKDVFYATENKRKAEKQSENPYRKLRDRKG